MRKLYRSRKETMISGVCGGLGQYFGIDPTLVRIFFVVLAFYHMLGVWAYLVMMLLLPIAPEGYEDATIPPAKISSSQTAKVIGGGLVAIGILALVSSLNINFLSWLSLANLWPVVLILFGIVLLLRVFNQED